jgi:hypothetical protein
MCIKIYFDDKGTLPGLDSNIWRARHVLKIFKTKLKLFKIFVVSVFVYDFEITGVVAD